MLTLSFLGALGDTYGRRPIILLAFAAYVVMFAIYYVSARFLHDFTVVAIAVALRAMLSAFPPMGHAMAADLSSPGMSLSLSLLFAFTQLR